jgi:hypothetical protein
VQLDEQGYPQFLDVAVPPWLQSQAQQAVQMCPSLALTMTTTAPRESPKPAAVRKSGGMKLISNTPAQPGLDVSEEWIADLSDVGRQIPRPIK